MPSAESHGLLYMSVFDGHGGAWPAQYASDHLHQYLFAKPELKEHKYEEALASAFAETDRRMLRYAMDGNVLYDPLSAGTTAVAVLVDLERELVICANVGDARAILVYAQHRASSSWSEETSRAHLSQGVIPLSTDHKPTNPDEERRIRAAYGLVDQKEGRVGSLNVSRSLGNFAYKMPNVKTARDPYINGAINDQHEPTADLVSAVPSTCLKSVAGYSSDGDLIILLGSDGVFFDSMTGQNNDAWLVKKTIDLLDIGWNASEITYYLVQKSISRSNMADNTTLILMVLERT